jgi:hypothetical protein
MGNGLCLKLKLWRTIKKPGSGNLWTAAGRKRNHRQIINACLARLKTKRILLTLLHRGYESGCTILIGGDHQQLEIDRPADCPIPQPKLVSSLGTKASSETVSRWM